MNEIESAINLLKENRYHDSEAISILQTAHLELCRKISERIKNDPSFSFVWGSMIETHFRLKYTWLLQFEFLSQGVWLSRQRTQTVRSIIESWKDGLVRGNFFSLDPRLAKLMGDNLLKIAQFLDERSIRKISRQILFDNLSKPVALNSILFCIYLFFAVYLKSFNPADWSYPLKDSMRIIPIKQGLFNLEIDQTVSKKPIIINGISYTSGLGTHAPSIIKIKSSKKSSSLKGKCGLPDYIDGPEIICIVREDEIPLFLSQRINSNHRLESFQVTVSSKKAIFLEIQSLKPDSAKTHGVWVDLKFN